MKRKDDILWGTM